MREIVLPKDSLADVVRTVGPITNCCNGTVLII